MFYEKFFKKKLAGFKNVRTFASFKSHYSMTEVAALDGGFFYAPTETERIKVSARRVRQQ